MVLVERKGLEPFFPNGNLKYFASTLWKIKFVFVFEVSCFTFMTGLYETSLVYINSGNSTNEFYGIPEWLNIPIYDLVEYSYYFGIVYLLFSLCAAG